MNPRLKIIFPKVLGLSFDARFRQSKRRYGKFLVKTKTAIARAPVVSAGLVDQSLKKRFAWKMAGIVESLDRGNRRNKNTLDSYEEM